MTKPQPEQTLKGLLWKFGVWDELTHDQHVELENFLTASNREARIEGRKDAISCRALIEQEWRSYRGSSNFQEVALQTIEEAELSKLRGQG